MGQHPRLVTKGVVTTRGRKRNLLQEPGQGVIWKDCLLNTALQGNSRRSNCSSLVLHHPHRPAPSHFLPLTEYTSELEAKGTGQDGDGWKVDLQGQMRSTGRKVITLYDTNLS